MEDKINDARLSFICNQDWNNMEPDVEGRFCNSCQKKVYNLNDKNVAYFIEIMQENKASFCGRFSRDQVVAPLPVYQARWKRWLVTAMVFAGIGAIGQKPVHNQPFCVSRRQQQYPQTVIARLFWEKL